MGHRPVAGVLFGCFAQNIEGPGLPGGSIYRGHPSIFHKGHLCRFFTNPSSPRLFRPPGVVPMSKPFRPACGLGHNSPRLVSIVGIPNPRKNRGTGLKYRGVHSQIDEAPPKGDTPLVIHQRSKLKGGPEFGHMGMSFLFCARSSWRSFQGIHRESRQRSGPSILRRISTWFQMFQARHFPRFFCPHGGLEACSSVLLGAGKLFMRPHLSTAQFDPIDKGSVGVGNGWTNEGGP